MNCMKCGRKTQDNQVFCQECLADMEKYPIKPGTVVQLPKRPENAPAKRPAARKRFSKPEEQIAYLKKCNRRLLIALLALSLAFVAVSSIAIYFMDKQSVPAYIGQNYSTVSPDNSSGK